VNLLALLLLTQAPLPPNHPPADPNAPAPSADELVKRLDSTPGLKERDKPFEIAASLGRLYVGQGRAVQAKPFYEQALAKAEPVRVFYLSQKKALGSRAVPEPEKVGCAAGADETLDALFTKAQAKAKANDVAAATACARAALKPVQEVDVQWGNLLFVLHDVNGALTAYTHALDTFETNADARYARAATLLDSKGDDVGSLKQAKADFERFLHDAPTSAHAGQAKRLLERTTAAIEKGGISKLPQVVATAPVVPAPVGVQPPRLSPETMKAFENAPRTPEMEQNFVKLLDEAEEHLARGRFNDARANYLQVMPFQPNNPRVRAGMAWTMIRLNRQPMADTVWGVAIQNPDAISSLGDTLKSKGDADGAKALWTKLKDSVPGYAPKLEGKL
jgi:tetratricopeptide (TPR) repeat protein